jgi:hypothetical protein
VSLTPTSTKRARPPPSAAQHISDNELDGVSVEFRDGRHAGLPGGVPVFRISGTTCCASARSTFYASVRRHAPRRGGHHRNELRVYRQNDSQINVYSYSFWKSTQVKYFVPEKRFTVEDRRFRGDHFLTGMHARGGFEDERLLTRSWSVVVDLVCVSIIVWIASGLWGLPGHRRWGWLAILGGAASFLVFTMRL